MLLTVLLIVGFIAAGCVDGNIESIYPGTLWCTYNKTANAWNDSPLGNLEYEDACCRQHNQCPWTISPGQCQYDICNEYSYTLFHCACDNLLKSCLKKVGTIHAFEISRKYFNPFTGSEPVKCIQV